MSLVSIKERKNKSHPVLKPLMCVMRSVLRVDLFRAVRPRLTHRTGLQALAILRGEVPTRKRARQNDGSVEPPRSRTPFPGITSMAPMASPVGPVGGALPSFMHSPTLAHPGGFQPQDQESITAGGMYGHHGSDWPQRGPYTMARWREAIVK